MWSAESWFRRHSPLNAALGIKVEFQMNELCAKEILSPEELQTEVLKRLEIYDKKSLLEMFALYLGKAQLLEFALKKLLIELFGFKLEELERKTLGQTRWLLKEKGLREDYLSLLEGVVNDRNHAAHEMLANQAITASFNIEFSERMQFKELQDSAYNLEQAIILFDYIQYNHAWLPNA